MREPLDALPNGKRQLHLTGFMGSGKSTVGRHLARRLGWEFSDLDEEIARHAGKGVARVFAEDGESRFRTLEGRLLRQLVGEPRTVAALGGGTLMDPGNRLLCREAATLVWLRCPLRVIQRRCGERSRERPLWGSRDELERLLSDREPGYRSADITVDGSGPPEEVAAAVLAELAVPLR
jgi:shikimate kinase